MTPIKHYLADEAQRARVFQSLFFWMTPIKGGQERPKLDPDLVSILVLLDDSHQAMSIGGRKVE